ncbi:hypothetical protein EYF80_032873 [Liparis tanakae]|uniref:Uncharacterized protein n=1 Tax=Liparis tanakae TaxID=230148 RepID=A0A4Z2GVU8_9TELE|nr:hypothetical protein EYF80_032873 [Liparis tanakae]
MMTFCESYSGKGKHEESLCSGDMEDGILIAFSGSRMHGDLPLRLYQTEPLRPRRDVRRNMSTMGRVDVPKPDHMAKEPFLWEAAL